MGYGVDKGVCLVRTYWRLILILSRKSRVQQARYVAPCFLASIVVSHKRVRLSWLRCRRVAHIRLLSFVPLSFSHKLACTLAARNVNRMPSLFCHPDRGRGSSIRRDMLIHILHADVTAVSMSPPPVAITSTNRDHLNRPHTRRPQTTTTTTTTAITVNTSTISTPRSTTTLSTKTTPTQQQQHHQQPHQLNKTTTTTNNNSDTYLGRLATGKIVSGVVEVGKSVKTLGRLGGGEQSGPHKVTELFVTRGVTREPLGASTAGAGDIITVAGAE